MKFPKLTPNWFTVLPGTVKLASFTLFVIWCAMLITNPGFTLFLTAVTLSIVSIMRIVIFLVEKK